jgi:hypothetical protein
MMSLLGTFSFSLFLQVSLLLREASDTVLDARA